MGSPSRLSSRRNGSAASMLLLAAVISLCCAGRLGLCAILEDPSATTGSAALTFSPSSIPLPVSTSTSSSPFSPSGKDFPNPTTDPSACNRPAGRPSWLCDPDRILSKGPADEIEGILRDIAQAKKPFAKSACSGKGHQVALAALGRLDLSSPSSSSVSAADATEEFASSIMDIWGVGQAGCDDGVVVVLAKEDRQSFILAGRGALPKLPPRASAAILEAAKPLLRAGDVSGALKQIVVDVGLTLAGAPPPNVKTSSSFDWSTLLFFAVVLAIVVTSVRAAAQQRAQQRAASEAIEKLRREQAAAEAAARGGEAAAASAPSRFASSSCPICLEDFTTVDPSPGDDDDDGGEGGGGGVLGGPQPSAPPPSAPLLPSFLRSSSTSPSAPPLQRRRSVRPLTVHCGHVFCGDCISRWTSGGHDSCPICRSPLAAAAPSPTATAAAAGAPAASSPPSSSSYRPYPGYRDELAFRLGSLHRLYPAVVTAEVLSEWLGQARRGSPLTSWESVRRQQLAENSRVAGRRRQEGARFGAVGGFGGGGSAGGGGAGSSW